MTTNSAAPARAGLFRRLSWLWVLIAGVGSYLIVLRTLVATENLNFVPSLILLGSAVVPAAVLAFAASGGRQVLVSPGWLALIALSGGIIGTVAAGTLEYDALHRLGALPIIMVGLIEETAKLIIPILALIFSRNRSPRVGVIIGVASGAGFATLENMGYAFGALLSTHSLVAVEQTLLLRGLLSPAGHVAWTGVTAAALWSVAASPRKGRALVRALGVFMAAVLLHAAWDGFNNVWVHVAVGAGSLIALLVAIHWAHRAPRRPRQRRR
jgi:protease PrsW